MSDRTSLPALKILSEYPPLPDLTVLKSRLRELKRLHLGHASVDYLISRLKPLVAGTSVNVFTFDPGRVLYRGRILKAPPAHASEVGLPPGHVLQRHGRLNRPGRPILYTNMAAGSVFREIRAEPGETVALACYRIKRPFFAVSSGFDAPSIQSKGWSRKINDWPAFAQGEEARRISLILNEFFAPYFLREVTGNNDYLYKPSVAWAELHLSAKQVDAVVYPSVANKAVSDNLAFKSDSVDNLLELVRVDFIRLDAYLGSSGDFGSHMRMTILQKADQIGSDGKLVFRVPNSMKMFTPSPMTTDLSFQLEDGLWTFTTSNGHLVASEVK